MPILPALLTTLAVTAVAFQVGPPVVAPAAQPLLAPRQEASLVTKAFVLVGDGIHSTGAFIGAAGLQAAVDSLPDGGTVFVGAGDYVLVAPVLMAADDLRLVGPGATLVSSGDPTVGCLRVDGDRCTVEDLALRDDAPGSSSRALLYSTGSDFRARDLSFSAQPSTGGQPEFVRLVGNDNGLVEACTFHPAIGWTGVHTVDGRNSRMIGCSFQVDGPSASMAYGYVGTNGSYCEVSGCSFVNVGTVANPLKAAILVVNDAGEGHHRRIVNNAFHTLTCERAVWLSGAQFDVLDGNSFGRFLGAQLQAAVDVDEGPQQIGARAVVISGNDFHNLAGVGASPALRLRDLKGVSVTGNTFDLATGTIVQIGGVGQEVVALSFTGNVFIALNPTVPAVPVVSITGGNGHVLTGNVFSGFNAPAMEILGVPAGDWLTANNLEN